MTQKEHIPLGVGFYPDWWFEGYGIGFGRDYYFNADYRVEAQAKMQKALYERFGFSLVGERRNYYENGEDAWLMTLDL